MFTSKEAATKAKWFSRRHETSDAHNESRNRRGVKVSAKRSSAQGRTEASANRTPGEQLRRLDERLGVEIGAKKERTRLHGLLVG